MSANGWLQILLFSAAVLACVRPLGRYLHLVMEGREHPLSRVTGPLERLVLRVSGIDRNHCPASVGISVRLASESPSVLARNTQTRLGRSASNICHTV